jgi:hypothetical protein
MKKLTANLCIILFVSLQFVSCSEKDNNLFGVQPLVL